MSSSSDIVSGYLSFAIPRNATDQMVEFFQKLQSRMEELFISDCQLSITTLEEVFLTIAGTFM